MGGLGGSCGQGKTCPVGAGREAKRIGRRSFVIVMPSLDTDRRDEICFALESGAVVCRNWQVV